METLELHRGCPWDSMCINWGEVTLTNGDTKIKVPLQCANTHERKIKIVQPYERPRLHSPSYGSPGMHMVHS